MSNRPNADFESILSESDIPTTEAELEIKLKEQVVAAGSKVSNDSEMSPFWRWVRAAVIVPTIWLIKTLLAGYVLPNMFIATAERWALELKAWELNVTVKAAVKTQGLITLTKATASDEVTIAKGAIIQTLPIDGVTYQLQVLADTVIAIGDETGKVLVEAMTAGLAYNLPAGYFNILPVELPGVTAAVNEPDWITTSGANEETDEELALRLQNAFTSSGSWHIDDAYRAIIASVAGIRSDNIFFENTGNISPGTANAYIVMEVGETPQSLIDELNAHITEDDHHGHGDVLTCLAIADQSYDVSAEAVLADNMTQEKIDTTLLEIENRIRAAFRETEAFDEMTRAKPKSRFSVSKMASEIHSNMVTVKSIKISIDGVIQEDIVSALVQPRINTLVVSEES